MRNPYQIRLTKPPMTGGSRQYFRRGTDLSRFSQAYLNRIALRLNRRPRKTLGFETPADRPRAVLHYYVNGIKTSQPDSPTGEILRARHQDRYSSNNIFVTIYVHAKPRASGMGVFAGGRTFNGAPNTGGGSLELELSSVLYDEAIAF